MAAPDLHSKIDRIGRYEISGRIAMGGMAELLLGRLRGPSGFDRPVVIKRILPHLADLGNFEDMFLDEARIAAKIQHPNVVQVSELGREDGELFLVMEYLQGETLSTVMRRLAARGETFSPELAAHVCAEAAAGLHAAHELKDLDGESVGLVHRDVSPQNLFITYDGGVKVLDFGIATASDRLTKTAVGEIKGKIAYMSPEQAKGEALDRRSDVFALGIVLFEAVLSRRLFKRSSQVATLGAVVGDRIPRMSEVDEVPEALDAICAKALARAVDQRYATTAEMRRELSEFAAGLGTQAVIQERLAGLMTSLFEDRIEEKSDMLRAFRAGAQLESVPAGDVDLAVELPSVAIDTSELSLITKTPVAKPGRGHAKLWLALGVVVCGVAAAMGWSQFSRGVDAPAPEVRPTLRAEEEPPQPSPAAEPSEPSESDQVELSADSRPTGAQVFVAGEAQGTTPLTLRIDRSDAPVEVRLELDGYEAFTESVRPNVSSRLVATLMAARSRSMRQSMRTPMESEMRVRPETMRPTMAGDMFQAW